MKSFQLFLLLTFLIFEGCTTKKENETTSDKPIIAKTSIIFLGTIQDAGFPQIGCKKECCKDVFCGLEEKRKVISLGLIDVPNSKNYLFEATPDIVGQMKRLTSLVNNDKEVARWNIPNSRTHLTLHRSNVPQ